MQIQGYYTFIHRSRLGTFIEKYYLKKSIKKTVSFESFFQKKGWVGVLIKM